jgi:hypothetical protein
VIGRDAGCSIGAHGVIAETGCVPVDGQAALVRSIKFGADGGIIFEHTGHVHHLGKVRDAGQIEQARNRLGPQFRASTFEGSGRYTGGDTKAEDERCLAGEFEHQHHTALA